MLYIIYIQLTCTRVQV